MMNDLFHTRFLLPDNLLRTGQLKTFELSESLSIAFFHWDWDRVCHMLYQIFTSLPLNIRRNIGLRLG